MTSKKIESEELRDHQIDWNTNDLKQILLKAFSLAENSKSVTTREMTRFIEKEINRLTKIYQ
ncbi:hypothetical protein PU629_03310 [Pullulanibacillus sp. KACC 23026]|uniref:hypothetical protein n=1 Tax=Pullulanibacillus sp. KACC 23026 TaxID=3028315 RepID=UPI0023B02D40|nr:hypothetical protein [Pullulanibacillus sp. KACC 23026]WEG13410.1 hypothetical protein PU629_03310 [Pullulanibacillus sp. KACC 23026]